MTLGAVPETGALPRRGRQLIPASLPWRREGLAACAVTLVAGHLVLAPVTLAVAIVLAAAGRVIRWRPWWLLCPAAAGLAWMLATGTSAALARFTAWPSGILGPLSAGHRTAHPGHPLIAFHLAWSSLPGQLPVALISGAAEAAVLGWLAWLHTDEWALPPRRAGLLAAVRGRLTGAAIRAGAVLTRDGCALGVTQATGAIAELRWAETSGGLLITGDDSRDVTLASLQIVHAALRRRKPLIVFDHGTTSAIGRALTAACLATGTPLRQHGSAAGVANSPGFPQRAAGRGSAAPGRAPDNEMAADSAWGGHQPGGTWGTDGSDMTRGSYGSDMTSGTGGAGASGLWGRARGGLAEGARDTRSAATVVDPDEVILARSAALLPADSAEAAACACADLAALAQRLRAIGVDGDGLIWIPRGDLVPAADLAVLLRDAPAAGLQVLVGATSPAAAADLAVLAGAALILRVTDPALASRLAGLTGVRLVPAPAGSFADSAGAGGGARAGARPPSGMPATLAVSSPLPGMPAMPAVSPPPPAALRGVSVAPLAGPAQPAVPAVPGIPAASGIPAVSGVPPVSGIPSAPEAGFTHCPVVSPRTLQTLRRGEFVLAVNVPRRRLVALGRLIPARLPRTTGPPHEGKGAPSWRVPEVGGR